MTEYCPQPITHLQLPGTVRLLLAIAIPVVAALAAAFGSSTARHALSAIPEVVMQSELVATSLQTCLREAPTFL
jgi:mannose/fructose/N-acetylgalactosamine-specific phosphotransferase system component IIC